jgi:hypothetical protein
MLIRPGTVDDIPGIKRIVDSFYEYRWSHEYYRWQYFGNPHPVTLRVAVDGERVVGTFGLQRRTTSHGLVVGHVSWINIDRAHQGKGIFRTLGEEVFAAAAPMDGVCVFANGPAAGACQKTLRMPLIGGCERLLLQSEVPAPRFTVEELDAGSAYPTPHLGRDRLVFDHSARFRAWRYANPAYRYSRVSLAPDAFAVVKLFGDSDGDIVDVEADLDDADGLRDLVSAAVAYLRGRGAARITTWALPGSPLRAVVEGLGFRGTGHSSHFCLRPLSAAGAVLADFSAWHLVQADATNY